MNLQKGVLKKAFFCALMQIMKQKEALEILKMGHNVFLTGSAGSGKTFLLNQYIDYLKKKKVNVGVTASTGIAATHMNGVTVHSWSGMGIKDKLSDKDIQKLLTKKRLKKNFGKTKILVIDEISMLHHFQLDLVDRLCKAFKQSYEPFGGMQVILCGDFFQLPPVSKENNKVCFVNESDIWSNMNLKVCYLDEQHRHSDSELTKVLNDIRADNVGEHALESLKKRYRNDSVDSSSLTKLYTHNVDVDAVNNRALEKLGGKLSVSRMTSRGNSKLVETLKRNCLAPEELTLKKGALVMFVKNSIEGDYVNGTLGIVVDFSNDGLPVVKTSRGRIIHAGRKSWVIEEEGKAIAEISQIPLRLAWAITVHKSQGMTLDAAEIDLSRSFVEGMGYVALSRVRSLSGLKLIGLNDMALRINKEVLEFDKELIKSSGNVCLELNELSSQEKEKRQKEFKEKLSVVEPVKHRELKSEASLNNLEKLKNWRYSVAKKEGVELYRVLPNKAIEAIAELEPKTKEELISIKGIKEKKFEKYGLEILSLVSNQDDNSKVYTVSRYLDTLNSNLKNFEARVKGEISSLDIRDNYLFFSIKDTKDESILPCFMWKRNYELCGVEIKEGMEIIVDGFPEVYKPSGKLSLRTSTVELVGEGVLKQAYDALKKKLEKEGLFLPKNKKSIPEFPKKVGLITSETGAVIHDFLNNLGKHGYKIKFVDSRVEGQAAVRNLVSAIDCFVDKDIDVLVIMRGGGSLESLQAFNNEVLVRKIADFRVPVICGIGHDKDVPLASMVADKAVSTPTAVTKILDETWDGALSDVNLFAKEITYNYQRLLGSAKLSLEELSNKLLGQFNIILKKFEKLKLRLINAVANASYNLKDTRKTLMFLSDSLVKNLERLFEAKNSFLSNAEKQLKIFDPICQLKLGYSIVYSNKKIIKSIKQVTVGENIDIQVSDGKISSKVNDIINK